MNIWSTGGPHVKHWSCCFRDTLQDYILLYMFIAQWQGQIYVTLNGKKWLLLHVYYCTFQLFVFNIFWENDCSTFSPCKMYGTQIWPRFKKVKGLPRIIISTNLVDLESQTLYAKIQSQNVFNIYGHGGHLFEWCETLWTNHQYPSDKTHMWNPVKIGQSVS